jgi:hypothetical protein
MLSTELQCVNYAYALVVKRSQAHLACFSGLQIRCEPGEFAIFDPPTGLSCAAWAGDFVDAFGGYLENPGDTQACRYCQYKVSLTFE